MFIHVDVLRREILLLLVAFWRPFGISSKVTMTRSPSFHFSCTSCIPLTLLSVILPGTIFPIEHCSGSVLLGLIDIVYLTLLDPLVSVSDRFQALSCIDKSYNVKLCNNSSTANKRDMTRTAYDECDSKHNGVLIIMKITEREP